MILVCSRRTFAGIALGLIGFAVLSGCCCFIIPQGKGYQKVGRQWSWVYLEKGVVPVTTTLSDDAAFTILKEDYAAKDSSRVYLREKIIAGADPATFELMSGDYSKDAAHVFRYIEPIPNADPETFELLEQAEDDRPIHFTKDKARAYFGGRALPGADPKTFKPLRWFYSCDASHVYHEDNPLPGADAATFQFLDLRLSG